ncbi:hypothetical protein BDV96DRAFT_649394 [Lophiotrema nucula]|uniref:RING-type domain-containing protein n=1 Tax=Lophiotrema nucula TaxID=690887 RepID=A0A6A5Z119_9PLEO|nr:hypothetical protein BDV96DRAFT_649394 [Lophiotrema nucula]
MANQTETESPSKNHSSPAVAIVLPCLFAIILVVLLIIAFTLPRLTQGTDIESREAQRKRRLEVLDKSIKAQNFVDWAAKQRLEHPEAPVVVNPICVICLEEISEQTQIRGLGCLHVFHQVCLDGWFGRCHEWCPLCHRPIIEGIRQVKKKTRTNQLDQPNVGLIV